MSLDLVDSHCHLDSPAFEGDRDGVLAACAVLGIRDIVIPGVVAADWDRVLATADSSPLLHAALGLHPLFVDRHCPEHLDRLRAALARCGPIVAIGEIGLDFYRPEPDRDSQYEWFVRQVEMAVEFDVPVILHVRRAHDQVLQVLRRHRLSAGGVVHAFGGSLQQAQHYLQLGFLLGFGGAVTHPRALRLRACLRELPREGLVLETDAPDMPPAGHQGERNSPLNLPGILEEVAAIRGEPPIEVAAYTSVNARRLFRLC